MIDPTLARILQHLQTTGFADLAGARIDATIPVSEALINRIVTETMPPNLPVRQVSIRPEVGDRLSVRLTPRAGLIPPITIKLNIERQPDLPHAPELVLRMATLPGLFGLAGAALPIGQMLPPGVRLQGELIIVDLAALAARHGASAYLSHLTGLQAHTDAGRLLLTIRAGIS